jgi:hypothetical protein
LVPGDLLTHTRGVEPVASAYAVRRDPGWRRFVLGLVLRSLRTVAGYGVAALAVFIAGAVIVDRALVGDSPPVPYGLLAVLYVALGVVAGVNLGAATALRRESATLVERSGWIVGPIVERALTQLAVPKEGIATERLRDLAELRAVARPHRGIHRLVAAFAVRRVLEEAGVAALQARLLGLVEQAETLGHGVVGRELVEAAARDGLTAAIARQLERGWRTNRTVAIVATVAALASLPVIAWLVL